MLEAPQSRMPLRYYLKPSGESILLPVHRFWSNPANLCLGEMFEILVRKVIVCDVVTLHRSSPFQRPTVLHYTA